MPHKSGAKAYPAKQGHPGKMPMREHMPGMPPKKMPMPMKKGK